MLLIIMRGYLFWPGSWVRVRVQQASKQARVRMRMWMWMWMWDFWWWHAVGLWDLRSAMLPRYSWPAPWIVALANPCRRSCLTKTKIICCCAATDGATGTVGGHHRGKGPKISSLSRIVNIDFAKFNLIIDCWQYLEYAQRGLGHVWR